MMDAPPPDVVFARVVEDSALRWVAPHACPQCVGTGRSVVGGYPLWLYCRECRGLVPWCHGCGGTRDDRWRRRQYHPHEWVARQPGR